MRPTDVIGNAVKVVLRVIPFSGHGLVAMFDKTTARFVFGPTAAGF